MPINMSAERGFTLLELVIASSLLALLGLSTALVLSSGLTSAEQLDSRSSQLQQLDRALLIVQQDIAAMLPRANRASDSLNLSPDSRQALWGYGSPYPEHGLLLEFVRPSPWATSPWSGLQRVRYKVQTQQLIREHVDLADPAPGAPWQRRVLLQGLKSPELLFLSRKNWYPQWQPGPMGDQIPDAILLKFSTKPWGGLQFVLITGVQQ
ncbi:MAG: type II secretion system minor pseudopilin GspJ [Marinobacterium sp.]|nr:type II secretion system minor pseudopilin GspJ [Marinobacterium sp.]